MEQNIGVNRSFRNFRGYFQRWDGAAGFALHVPRSEQRQQAAPVSEKFCELAERKSRDEIIAVSAATSKRVKA